MWPLRGNLLPADPISTLPGRQERLRGLEVICVMAASKLRLDRAQVIERQIGRLLWQPRQTHRGPQLPDEGTLLASEFEAFTKRTSARCQWPSDPLGWRQPQPLSVALSLI
jgi:hypothetical protein